MKSSICAIIPTYNRAAMLHECIESILDQTRKVDQIIVVNDGSTDDTENVVKSYGSRITLINKSNGGKSSALNLALPLCTSDYVWICDDDDLAEPDGVALLAETLDADDSIGFVYGTYRHFYETPKGRCYSDPFLWAEDDETNATLRFLEGMFTHQFAMLVRRSLFQEVGPFREEMIRSQDYEMAIRLSRQASAKGINKVIFSQRQHAGMRGSAGNSFSIRENAKKWRDYGRLIFPKIIKEMRLEEFAPTFALTWEKPLLERATRLQRACVFARHSMWNDALGDLHAASKLSSIPATPQELKVAERFMVFKPPLHLIGYNYEWIAGIRAVYKENEYGHNIVHAACRPLVWQVRYRLQQANILEAMRTSRILIGILGFRGFFSRIWSSFIS